MSVPFYPDCSTCGHNASGVLGGTRHGRCTVFKAYPPGDPRGMAGYCNCPCTQDPVIQAWLEDTGRGQPATPPHGGEAAP